MQFKFETGEHVELIPHIGSVVLMYGGDKTMDLRIYVGCDSQNRRYNTAYVTVVAFRYGTRGTHFVYKREGVKKIKDRWTRLWGEVTRTVDLAREIESHGFKISCVDFDFNEKEIARSNEMVSAAKGYAIGFGFNCTCKPEEQVASRAADHMVRR